MFFANFNPPTCKCIVHCTMNGRSLFSIERNNASLEVGKSWILTNYKVVFVSKIINGWSLINTLYRKCIYCTYTNLFIGITLCGCMATITMNGNFIGQYFLMNGSYFRSHYIYEWNYWILLSWMDEMNYSQHSSFVISFSWSPLVND